jgi:four helix bundle protein
MKTCVRIAHCGVARDRSSARKRDLRLRAQLRDAGESAERNVAEGFGRFQPTQSVHFLDISRGSPQETRTLLIKGMRVRYWNEQESGRLDALAKRALRAVAKFQRYLRSPQAQQNAERLYIAARPE